MSLKIALLLVGVIIIITVAIGVMDKSSIRRRRTRRSKQADSSGGALGTGGLTSHAIEIDENELPSVLSSASIVQSPSALEKKKLKASSIVPDLPALSEDRSLLDELESYEKVADLRLDVDPDIDSRVAKIHDAGESTLNFPTVADKVIDFTISLPGKKVISRNRALGLFKQNEYMLEKPRAIYGMRRATRVWTNIEADPDDTEYEDLILALQIVDENGGVGETELNTFVQMGLMFCDKFRRRMLCSLEVDEAMEVARGLHEFHKQHDVIASINVVANSPMGFPGNTIAAVANDLGMRFGEMNIFHHHRDQGPLNYSMANLFRPGYFDRDNLEKFRTKGLTLFMQVPRVAECVNVFSDMVSTAMHLADRMGGRLVDQDMKSLTESGINIIRRQIDSIASDMRVRGISPGGEAALRLFEV